MRHHWHGDRLENQCANEAFRVGEHGLGFGHLHEDVDYQILHLRVGSVRGRGEMVAPACLDVTSNLCREGADVGYRHGVLDRVESKHVCEMGLENFGVLHGLVAGEDDLGYEPVAGVSERSNDAEAVVSRRGSLFGKRSNALVEGIPCRLHGIDQAASPDVALPSIARIVGDKPCN